MMQLRNTPDPDCNTSPAQIVFGRPIRDAFAFVNRLEKFGNPNIHPVWRDAWQQKEDALRQLFHRTAEDRNKHAKSLPMLRSVIGATSRIKQGLIRSVGIDPESSLRPTATIDIR